MEYSEYSGSDDELDPDDLQEDEPLWDYARVRNQILKIVKKVVFQMLLAQG